MKPVLTRVESPTSLGRKRSSKHSTDELGDRSNIRQMSSKSFTNSAAMRSERSLESRELTLNGRPAGFVNNPLSMLVVGGEGDDSPHRHRRLVLFKKKRRRGRDSSPSERKIGGLITEGSRSKSRSPPPQKKGGLFSPLIADRPFLLAKEKSVAKAQKNHHEEKEYVHNLFRKGDKILDRIIQEKNIEQNRLQQRLADIHHTVYERDHWVSLGWIKRKQIGKDFDKYFATKPREEDSKSLLIKKPVSSPRKAAADSNWRPAWVKIVGQDRHTRSMEHSNLSRISNQPSSRHHE